MSKSARQQAIEAGELRYYSGVSCPKGHNSFRETRSGGCIECKNAYKRARYHAVTKTHQNEKSRSWKAENKARVKAYNEAYRKANPQYFKQWKQENKGLVNASTYKRRAGKMHRTPNWLLEDDLWLIKEIYDLATLRTKKLGLDWHVDHIIPLQGELVSGLHTPDNLQVIPAAQNILKGNRYPVK
jgi:hypothetical protein